MKILSCLLLCNIFVLSPAFALMLKDVHFDYNYEMDAQIEQAAGTCLSMGGTWDSSKNIELNSSSKCFDISCSKNGTKTQLGHCLPEAGLTYFKQRMERRIKDATFLEKQKNEMKAYEGQCEKGFSQLVAIPAEVKNDSKNCYVYTCVNANERKTVPIASVCNKNGLLKIDPVILDPNYKDRPSECEFETDEHKVIICPNEKRYRLEQHLPVVNSARDNAKPVEQSSSKTLNSTGEKK